MKSSIRIRKGKPEKESNDLITRPDVDSVERTTRKIVDTVKGWISESQQRKRAQRHSQLPIIATIPTGQEP